MSNTLAQAATLIEKVGWIRGQYSSGQGYCAVGALTWAARDHVDKEQAQHALAEAIRAQDNNGIDHPEQLDDWATIVLWNDNPFRTREDVLGLLRQLAGASS